MPAARYYSYHTPAPREGKVARWDNTTYHLYVCHALGVALHNAPRYCGPGSRELSRCASSPFGLRSLTQQLAALAKNQPFTIRHRKNCANCATYRSAMRLWDNLYVAPSGTVLSSRLLLTRKRRAQPRHAALRLPSSTPSNATRIQAQEGLPCGSCCQR